MFFAVCYMLKTCFYQFNTTFLDSCIIELAACEWLLFPQYVYFVLLCYWVIFWCFQCLTMLLQHIYASPSSYWTVPCLAFGLSKCPVAEFLEKCKQNVSGFYCKAGFIGCFIQLFRRKYCCMPDIKPLLIYSTEVGSSVFKVMALYTCMSSPYTANFL